ncbi:hypothetical protein ES703_37420 [subsurface metagenome]
MGIVNTPFTRGSPVIRDISMPQRVICSECAHILYESNIEINILRSPQDIAKKHEGRCPSCGKILKFSFKSVSIYPHEGKDE